MERIKVSSFGTLNDGRDVQLFTLENARGTYVEIMNLGGIIVSLHTADDSGNMTDITTGFDNPEQYISGSGYMVAMLIGLLMATFLSMGTSIRWPKIMAITQYTEG